jgi:hypothetical protein
MSAGTKPAADFKSRVFCFFISYAREDEKIAIAVYNGVQAALGPSTEDFIDSPSIQTNSRMRRLPSQPLPPEEWASDVPLIMVRVCVLNGTMLCSEGSSHRSRTRHTHEDGIVSYR